MDEMGHLCERARFWASLRLDGELSELEGALLDAHLRAAPAAVRSPTASLPRRLQCGRRRSSGSLPSRIDVPRSPRRLLATISVAAVLVLGVIAGGLVRGQVSHGSPAPRAVAVVASFETPDQIRALRRAALLNTRPIPRDLSAEPV